MTAPTTRETADHAELARLAEAATPGPWFAWIKSRTLQIDTRGGDGRLPAIINWPGFDGNDMSHGASKANARFIAAANPPPTVLSLLSEIAALRGEEQHLQELYETTGRQCDGWKDRAAQAERQRDELRNEAVKGFALIHTMLMTPSVPRQSAGEVANTFLARLANQGAYKL